MLYKAIEYGYPNLLRYLLSDMPKIIGQTKENFNLLHIACRLSHSINESAGLEVVKTIKKHDFNATLNSQDTYGNTPLHLAVQSGKTLVIKYFLKEHHPSITAKNSEGKTPLHCAIGLER
jgi:ankyrin repeat protein